MSQEEFKSKIYDVIKDKAFISNGSGVLVDVVKKLPDEIVEGKVLFDGIMLFDGKTYLTDETFSIHYSPATSSGSLWKKTKKTRTN